MMDRLSHRTWASLCWGHSTIPLRILLPCALARAVILTITLIKPLTITLIISLLILLVPLLPPSKRLITADPFLLQPCSLQSPRPLHLAIDRRSNPDQPHNRRHNCIRNHARLAVVCQPQPQATVDDAQRDKDAAEPDMPVRPYDAAGVLFEGEVVEQAEDWLQD